MLTISLTKSLLATTDFMLARVSCSNMQKPNSNWNQLSFLCLMWRSLLIQCTQFHISYFVEDASILRRYLKPKYLPILTSRRLTTYYNRDEECRIMVFPFRLQKYNSLIAFLGVWRYDTFLKSVFFFFFPAWRSATRETTSPCAQCVTEPAATGNWSRLAGRPGPATCSTTRPPSSSPSSWHCGVSSSVLLSCSHTRFLVSVHQLLCPYILRTDLIWQMLEGICALVLHFSLIPRTHPRSDAELLKKLVISAKALNLPFLFWSPAVTGFEMKNDTLWQSYLITWVHINPLVLFLLLFVLLFWNYCTIF